MLAAAAAPRAAITAAAAVAAAAGGRRAWSGVVAGQDTPVQHKEDLPDSVKNDFTSVVDSAGLVLSAERAQQQPGSQEQGHGVGEGRSAGHPGPQQDPYSGGDQEQGEAAEKGP